MAEGMVHIRCGDDLLEPLAASGLPGQFLAWTDPVCEGPAPAGLDDAAFRAVRATWLAGRIDGDPVAIAADLADRDAALDRAAAEAADLTLWFEHDLYDQAILIRLLDRLRPRIERGGPVSLVCIGDHPGVDRFIGLGQLAPEDLPPLYQARQTLDLNHGALASAAWQAFTAPTPDALVALLDTDTSALPFLAPALRRHLRQFPWKADGLALTEWLTLDVIDLGVETPVEAFRYLQAREEAPWQGDLMYFAWLRDLCRDPFPLLIPYGTAWPYEATLALTDRGRAVLLGRTDALSGRPLDRWLGGVHLTGENPPWRFDAGQEALTRAG